MMGKIAGLVVLMVLASAVPAQTGNGRVIPSDFKSDKCSLFPDGNYADCCVEHDKDYYFGGTGDERRASDKRLKSCVLSKGHGFKRKLLANVMYLGVRIGAVSWLPTPFRWGFGNVGKQSKVKTPAVSN